MRSVLLLLATLCLLGAGPRSRVEPCLGDASQLASASPGLPAKATPRRSLADTVQRDQRRSASREAGAPLFVVTPAIRPLVEPPRIALPGAPGQPTLVIVARVPTRSSRGPPGLIA